MEEFLEKLQEDQRRMRKFLRSHALKFRKMGVSLAEARKVGSRVFVIGEPPLDGLAAVIAEEYLTHLPALPIDLTKVRPVSITPDASDEVPAYGRAASAKQAGRHLHQGDMVLAFLNQGEDRETRMVLEAARARRVRVLIVGGLAAKSTHRRLAKSFLALPTRGIKTICESAFICARILARISRASCRDAGVLDEARLVQTNCEMCTEVVFFEERRRGKKGTCPLCEHTMTVPTASGRRSDRVAQITDASSPEPIISKRRGKRRLKPSVLDLPTLRLEDSSNEEETRAPGYINDESAIGPPVGLTSRSAHDPGSVEGPSFGSDIMVGSDIVSVNDDEISDEVPRTKSALTPPPPPPPATPKDGDPTLTASADPFALEDGFLADLEMPQPASASGSSRSEPPEEGDDASVGQSKRLVSNRYSITDCSMRWGRGGYPDEDSPEHELIQLESTQLSFFLNADDPAASTLQQNDELWLRIEIPAFLEPILVRGSLSSISGISGNGDRSTRVELVFRDMEQAVRSKLARAAENLGAPA